MKQESSFAFLCFIVLTNLQLLNAQDVSRLLGQECTMEDNKGSAGITKYLSACSAAISNLKAGIEPTTVAKVKNNAVVCCPIEKRISELKCLSYLKYLLDAPARPLLPTSELESAPTVAPILTKCGIKQQPFIVGGRDAVKGEYPHIAAIGYGPNGKDGYKCGGTLISEKFVISAAHCISGSERPTTVLLGQTLLNETHDFYRIKNIIFHESRKNPFKYYDIVLFELEKPVKMNKNLRPACLPQPQDRLENSLEMTTAGWGYTEGFAGAGTHILQAVNLTRVPQKDCENIYNGKLEKEVVYPKGIIRSQFCAGDPLREKGTKDTCNGDSGGPLTVKKTGQSCFHYLMGITSFGSRSCGGGEPGVYTNVQSFLDWIEEKVWPGQ